MKKEDNNIPPEYQEIWDLAKGYTYEPAQETNAAWEKFAASAQQSAKKVSFTWVKFAAAAIIVALVGWGVSQFLTANGSPAQHFACTFGEVKHVKLSDGSIIELGSNSNLDIAQNYGSQNRNIKLKGHAKFTVTRNENLPFIIESPNVTTQVLGTVFEVKDYSTHAQVYVHSGKVQVANQNAKVLLVQNQKASYSKQQGLLKTTDTQWNTVGNALEFQSTSLVQISAEIEQITGRKLVIPSHLINEKFTGKFNNVADISTVCQVLSAAFNTTIIAQ